jgi:Uma2 family endonuclease
MMRALQERPPRNTGPLEGRDTGRHERRLGTPEDCFEGSPWELHQGELVEQMGSKDLHAVVMALIAALFRCHAQRGLRTMTDVYCALADEKGPSVRAPDVVLVEDAGPLRDDFVRVAPVLAVEVRASQAKKVLEEKVNLYVSHDWPLVWIAHADRVELEVHRPGIEAALFTRGSHVPLPAALHRYGLEKIPLEALFDEALAGHYTEGWVQMRTLSRLFERKLGRALTADELGSLHRALVLGTDHLTDLALDLRPAELAAWLADAPGAAPPESGEVLRTP